MDYGFSKFEIKTEIIFKVISRILEKYESKFTILETLSESVPALKT